ncbi:peroxisome biogenesis factor 10 [Strongylocentrotus purpuratus]|uniref:RING-type E3 ubiquitin transferase n=1 Tax=Strongylocentrotus purpuratus TaxID=7668 RepID=A0A7M7NVU5_STRPU|nr:peroxisome biogenesis factor 10 [Strongylocentrotus purpuratus]
MATFQSAGQAEIIRSSQKDEAYQTQLRGSIHDVVQSLIGTRFWARWRKELDVVSDVLYFGLTTIAGFQTLGEEYVNILQVDGTKRAVPSLQRRIALVALHIGAPYLLDKTLSRLSFHLEAGYRLSNLSEEANNRLRLWLPSVRRALTFVNRVHMAAFYLRGLFYHIAKRFSGVNYIQVRRTAVSQALQKSFHILGWLSGIQLSVSLLWHALQLRKMVIYQSSEATEEKERSVTLDTQVVDPRWRCSLCLERRQHTTCPPCGHLYCWGCIMEWCRTKPECPICRDGFQASRLVRLQNYDRR